MFAPTLVLKPPDTQHPPPLTPPPPLPPPQVETSKMPFKQMENISNFLKACRVLGVAEHDLFETVDLFEQKVRRKYSLYAFVLLHYTTM